MPDNQETYEQTMEIIDNDFSPLDAPVKKRNYTQHKFEEAHAVMDDLAEPTFQPPSFESFDEVQEEEKEPERVFNESYSELDGKEKKMGAKMMAEMTLDLYEKGCGFLGKLPEISQDKLDQMIAEGEIDPNIQLQTESGALPVKDFATEYNESIKEAFGVSEEFKEKVKPPLIRVFEKRGIGMTDEQLLMYYFATDLGAKGVQAFMLKKTANSIIQSLKDNTSAIRESQSPTPRQAPVPKQSPVTANDDNDYTANISEVVVEEVSKRKQPKTVIEKQLENFTEPEEDGVYSILSDRGGFKFEGEEATNMPSFGDPDILAGLEKLSNEPVKPVRTRKSTAKKPVRKPRAKK